MEKVKLPKEICKILDNMRKECKNDDFVLWSIMQYYATGRLTKEMIDINKFARNGNSLKLAQAMLHGYEPEETEEERKERDIKQKMLDYINDVNNVYLLYYQYIDELYDIAHGKK